MPIEDGKLEQNELLNAFEFVGFDAESRTIMVGGMDLFGLVPFPKTEAEKDWDERIGKLYIQLYFLMFILLFKNIYISYR